MVFCLFYSAFVFVRVLIVAFPLIGFAYAGVASVGVTCCYLSPVGHFSPRRPLWDGVGVRSATLAAGDAS